MKSFNLYSFINRLACIAVIALISAATVSGCPTAVITYSGSLCAGTMTTLYANTGNSITYQWLFNGQPIGGANLPTYNAITAGNYSVQEDIGGCQLTSAVVTMYALPTVSVSPDATICSGTTSSLTATGA